MSLLSDYFSEKSLLLTGSTGFLGKCLLEKILYSCPNITTIYVLMRSKGGQTSQKRLNLLFQSEVFERIRRETPHQLAKVIALSGDVTIDELALSPLNRDLVIENVSLIINCAATIRFDEPLKRALQLNVGSTKRLLILAKKCLKLEAMVHVSTAYCTRDKSMVLEEVIGESYSPLRLLEASDWMNDEMFSSLEKHLLSTRISSYHLSKGLAEQLLKENKDNIPLAIIRPSIIIGSAREPFEGWVDNYNGITGFLVATGKGILRSLHCNENALCDVIPVDLVVNTILASMRHVTVGHPFVVNCVSGRLNPLKWKDILELSRKPLLEFPSMELFRSPHVTLHSERWIHFCHSLLEHVIPAFLVDVLFRACGLNPILGKVYQKLNRSMNALEEFTRNEWHFQCNNQQLLAQQMSREDKQVFPLDVSDLNWKKYFENFQKGIRIHLLKEKEETIVRAKHKLNKYLQNIVFILFNNIFSSLRKAFVFGLK